MTMKKHLLKTLLVATGLLAGTLSSWAEAGDVKTNIDIDFSNAIENNSVTGTIGSMTIGQNSATNKITEINNGILVLGSGTHSVLISEEERAKSKDIVTTSFDLAFGKLTNRTVGFYFEDADGNKIGEFSFIPYSSSLTNDFGVETSDMYFAFNTVIWDRRATFSITYNYAKQTITTTVLNNYTKKSASHTVSMKSDKPIAKFCVTSNYDNTGRRCQFDNLKITTTEGDYSAQTNKVSLAFVTSDNEQISNEELPQNTITSYVVDNNSEFTPTYPESFMTDDYIYTYVSGGDKVTVSQNTEIKLVYNKEKREKVNIVVNCIDSNGNILLSEPKASNYPKDKDYLLAKSQYIIKDGVLYETEISSPAYYVQNIKASKDAISIKYDKKEIDGVPVYFKDFGDTPNTDIASTEYLRASGGQTETSATKVTLVPANTLASGYYNISIRHYKNRAPIFKVGDREIGTCDKGANSGVMVTSEFTNIPVFNGEELYVVPATEGGYTDNIDYVLVIKGSTETVTIGKAEYATYVTGSDVKIPENVNVYTVTANANGIEIHKVSNTVVPARTALLINGAEGTYPFEVSSETGKALGNNNLKASNGAKATGVEYCLTQQDGKIGFAKVQEGIEIPAGKAYLVVNAQAASNFFALDDTVTAIKNIETEKTEDNAYYTLQGVKVVNPAKGIYIHNGKKVVIK